MASTSFLPHRPRPHGPTIRSSGGWSLRSLAGLILVIAFVAPATGSAFAVAAADPSAQARQERDEIRRKRAELAAQIDLVKASDDEVAAALHTIDLNVAAQTAKVDEAKKAIEDADLRVADLNAQIAQNEADISRIEGDLRKEAVNRYVNPEGTVDTAKMFKSANFDQAEQRRVLADTVSGNHRDVIDEFRSAKAKIADLRQQADEARAEADRRRQDEQVQLDELQVAREQQAAVVAEWNKRLANLQDDDAKLAAADAELASFIQQKQAEAAAAEAAAAAARAPRQVIPGASTTSSASNGTAPPGTGTTSSTAKGGTAAPPPTKGTGTGRGMIWPIAGRVSQEFHGGHPGMDIFAPMGTPIYAALGGTVIYAQMNSGGYGNLVVVDHGNGLSTAYAHQSSYIVSVGQSVSQGQQIGYEGSTGYSTGPHLHFETRINGSVVNPRGYLP